jgi:mono/diheme cytochrome c family protein
MGRAVAVLLVLFAAGCRQDMHDQPKYKPFRESDFFPDRRAARPFVPGTVARGTLREDTLLYTGKLASGAFTDKMPMPVSAELLERGRVEYQTFCAPCHARTGTGDGMIVQRGFKKPFSFHIPRLRLMPVGYFFDVITNGFGAMSDYAAQVRVEERWAIAAYVRALQLSQYAPLELAPEAKRAELEAAAGAGRESP